MKKYIFILVQIFAFTTVMAQTDIDRVNSDSSAMALFKKYIIRGDAKSNYNDFKLTEGTEWVNYYNFNDEQKNRLLSQYKYQRWAKIDLNNDKKHDLIISGYLSKTRGYSNHYRMFIFLTNPQNNELDFVRFNSREPQYFRIVNVDTSKYIEVSTWANNLYKTAEGIPLRIDTVEFQPSLLLFIDKEKQTEATNIKKVTYRETQEAEADLEAAVTLSNNKSGNFSIKLLQRGQTKPTVNNARISAELTKDFTDIVTRLKKYDAKEINPASISDNSVKRSIEVEYIDGSKMLIEDNVGSSSYTLAALYEWFTYSINSVYEQLSQIQYYNYSYDPFGW